MATSQSAVARLETTAADVKLSTFERFAAALGYRVQYRLVAESQSEPLVVIQHATDDPALSGRA